jgi:hypothetical protein
VSDAGLIVRNLQSTGTDTGVEYEHRRG